MQFLYAVQMTPYNGLTQNSGGAYHLYGTRNVPYLHPFLSPFSIHNPFLYKSANPPNHLGAWTCAVRKTSFQTTIIFQRLYNLLSTQLTVTELDTFIRSVSTVCVTVAEPLVRDTAAASWTWHPVRDLTCWICKHNRCIFTVLSCVHVVCGSHTWQITYTTAVFSRYRNAHVVCDSHTWQITYTQERIFPSTLWRKSPASNHRHHHDVLAMAMLNRSSAAPFKAVPIRLSDVFWVPQSQLSWSGKPSPVAHSRCCSLPG